MEHFVKSFNKILANEGVAEKFQDLRQGLNQSMQQVIETAHNWGGNVWQGVAPAKPTHDFKILPTQKVSVTAAVVPASAPAPTPVDQEKPTT